jgi:hypothetical protein
MRIRNAETPEANAPSLASNISVTEKTQNHRIGAGSIGNRIEIQSNSHQPLCKPDEAQTHVSRKSDIADISDRSVAGSILQSRRHMPPDRHPPIVDKKARENPGLLHSSQA